MKKAIYLDDRERKLARVAMRHVIDKVEASARIEASKHVNRVALDWLRDDLTNLLTKFAENGDES